MRLSIRLALSVLRNSNLTLEERNLSTALILDKLDAIPLSAIISVSGEEILINGREEDIEKLHVLRENARAALINQASNLVDEQVKYLAIKEGLGSGIPPEGLLFYRAALWFAEQRKQYLQILAQERQELSL